MFRILYGLAILIGFFASVCAIAGGNSVATIYTPYVQALENELEYEFIYQNDQRSEFSTQQRHCFSYGQSISDRWLVEAGISGVNTADTGFDISGFELEAKYQITEQGEYSADWGLLMEIEREPNNGVSELGTTLIGLRDWNRWTTTANLSLAYEFGGESGGEFESELAAQLKYRFRPSFEPGLEYFKSESTNSVGPSASGKIRLGGGKSVYWGTAALFSFDRSKPDQIFRANIEFEF